MRETRSALRAFEVSDSNVVVRQLLHNIKREHASPHSKWALCDFCRQCGESLT